MTSAEPFPAAKLGGNSPGQVTGSPNTQRKVGNGRVQHSCIRNVECRHLELLKHDFGHAFAVGGSVPGGLGDEDGMILRFAIEDIFQRVANHRRDRLEVGDFGDKQGRPSSPLHARRKKA